MKHPSMASSSPIILFNIFSMWLLISFSEARQFLVGGSEKLWKVPLPSPDSLSEWTTHSLFRIGDSIVFEYDNKTESVHAVNEEDYSKCNIKGKHVVFNDGNTEVVFTESGTYHFISGNQRSCMMGLKLTVVVTTVIHSRLAPPLPPLLSPPAPLFSPPPSTSLSPSPSPLPNSLGGQGAPILSPSLLPSPSLSPQSSGNQGGDGNGGFIMWLGVSLALMVFLI